MQQHEVVIKFIEIQKILQHQNINQNSIWFEIKYTYFPMTNMRVYSTENINVNK